MSETERITKLFEDLYEGDPWIDVNIIGTLEEITAEQAARRVISECNSIWEILNHLIKWRLAVSQRIQGITVVGSDNNYFEPVKDISEASWKSTLVHLKDSQKHWIEVLRTFDESALDTTYQNGITYYEQIHGIIQHDAYHLGQIVMLAKRAKC